ncbi:polysaccharide pyruvyl transferase family protein [Algihabitans albus]|uniref:polysaccharide pyruvyl transferase family protein n=1 Tax=Algihabitans albus TaxID=2164067 RepID=UPI0013C2EF8C|nr:polysaccharide pyruvyl transferase family protein [Algihabitans albus]
MASGLAGEATNVVTLSTLRGTAVPSLTEEIQTRLRDLRSQVLALGRLLPADRPIVYLDYPLHLNVGDLCLQLGAEQLFSDLGLRVLGRASMFNGKAWLRRRLDPSVTIVLHAGGNLGDLWPGHQDFREAVVAAFPNNRIVVLPQSLHFADRQGFEACMRRWAQHPDLHLVLRDRVSYGRVAEHLGDRAYLAPDLAHCLYEQAPFHKGATTPGKGSLRLVRQDVEALVLPDHAAAATQHFDWAQIYTAADRRAYALVRRLHRLDDRAPVNLPIYRPWRRLAERAVTRGAEHLCRFAEVDSDRLHGMLMSLLLHRHVRWRESRTGKTGAYVATWLSDLPGSALAQAGTAA